MTLTAIGKRVLITMTALALALLGLCNAGSALAAGAKRPLHSPVVQGWFWNLSGEPTGQGSLLELPASVNLVDFWGTLKNYTDEQKAGIIDQVDTLHSQGRVVVHDIWLSRFVKQTDLPNTEEGYAEFAKMIYEETTAWHLDGIDIDLENGIMLDNDDDTIAILNALAKYFGPKSDTGKYLIIDTNLEGSNNIIKDTVANDDYVILQAYWRAVGSLTSIWNTYKDLIDSRHFIVTVDFEDGTGWTSYGDSNCPEIYDYAAWARNNNMGGVGSYKINKDYVNSPPYKYTKGATRILYGVPESTVCGS